MRPTYRVTELLGDGIGAELSHAVHALCRQPADRPRLRADRPQPGKPPRPPENHLRRSRRSIETTGVALKYPTITAEESPNQVLRRRLDLSVIHRPVTSIPGVPNNFKQRTRRRYRPHRHRRHLRRPGPNDRRGRRGQPPHRRTQARRGSRPLHLHPGPQNRQIRHQLLQVHDPESHRRPLRRAS